MTKYADRTEHHGQHHARTNDNALGEQAATLLTSANSWMKGNHDREAKAAAVYNLLPKADQYTMSQWKVAKEINGMLR